MTRQEAIEILESPIIVYKNGFEPSQEFLTAIGVAVDVMRVQEEETWHYCPYCGKRLDVH